MKSMMKWAHRLPHPIRYNWEDMHPRMPFFRAPANSISPSLLACEIHVIQHRHLLAFTPLRKAPSQCLAMVRMPMLGIFCFYDKEKVSSGFLPVRCSILRWR